jgi:hypothetical protein
VSVPVPDPTTELSFFFRNQFKMLHCILNNISFKVFFLDNYIFQI